MDETTDGVSLAILASSPLQTASQQVNEKTAGTPNPNATSAEPVVPAGESHTQPDEPLDIYTSWHGTSRNDSQGEGGDIEVDHTITTPQETYSENGQGQ